MMNGSVAACDVKRVKLSDIVSRVRELENKADDILNALEKLRPDDDVRLRELKRDCGDARMDLSGHHFEKTGMILADADKDERYSIQVLLKEYYKITCELNDLMNEEVDCNGKASHS